jgi:hypothetical protein
MTICRRPWRRLAVAMLFAPVLSACSSGRASSALPSPGSSAAVSTPAGTSPADSESAASTSVPSAVSTLPNGVYRSQLDVALLATLGADPSDAGTWTLTVKDGTYRLDCAPMADPGTDCGNDGAYSEIAVEFGTLRGAGSTVWFVHDQQALSKLNGCVPGFQGRGGCGPDGGYHAHWTVVPEGLAFSDFVGLGDEALEPPLNEKTAQPWKRIA